MYMAQGLQAYSWINTGILFYNWLWSDEINWKMAQCHSSSEPNINMTTGIDLSLVAILFFSEFMFN